MNQSEDIIQEENPADILRGNVQEAQIAQHTANENARLQGTRLKNLAAFKKDKGGPTEHRLALGTFALMFGVAIFFDIMKIIINFIPFVGGLLEDITIAPIATLTFFIWLKMHGVNFTKGPRGFFFLLSVVLSFIPIINALPEWTGFIVGLYISESKISTSAQKSLKKIQGK